MENGNQFYQNIRQIILDTNCQLAQAAILALVKSNWLIEQSIVEDEQDGETRKAYGKGVLKTLSIKLSKEFGTYNSDRNLRHVRQFYAVFPNWNALRSKFSWTHYRSLMRVENSKARQFY